MKTGQGLAGLQWQEAVVTLGKSEQLKMELECR